MFGKEPKVIEVIKVVEVDTPRPREITDDIRTSVQALANQPGFQHLLSRCRAMRAYLKQQLCEGKHANMDEVAHLQAGIYWAGWLEQEMTRHQPVKPLQQPYDVEAQAFQEAQSLIDVVGK